MKTICSEEKRRLPSPLMVREIGRKLFRKETTPSLWLWITSIR
jgi:hypothetical protein